MRGGRPGQNFTDLGGIRRTTGVPGPTRTQTVTFGKYQTRVGVGKGRYPKGLRKVKGSRGPREGRGRARRRQGAGLDRGERDVRTSSERVGHQDVAGDDWSGPRVPRPNPANQRLTR